MAEKDATEKLRVPFQMFGQQRQLPPVLVWPHVIGYLALIVSVLGAMLMGFIAVARWRLEFLETMLYVCAVAFPLPTAAIIWLIIRGNDFKRRVRAGLICWRCLHSLRGLPEETKVCPECGFSIENTKSLLQQLFGMPEPWVDGSSQE